MLYNWQIIINLGIKYYYKTNFTNEQFWQWIRVLYFAVLLFCFMLYLISTLDKYLMQSFFCICRYFIFWKKIRKSSICILLVVTGNIYSAVYWLLTRYSSIPRFIKLFEPSCFYWKKFFRETEFTSLNYIQVVTHYTTL